MATIRIDEIRQPETFEAEQFIKDYFKPMRISEERKEVREEAARDFRDFLLFILTLIATAEAYNALNWAYIEEQFRLEMERAALEYARNSQALQDYIAEKASDFVSVTKDKDLSDPYWTSDERATNEAVNEANDVVGMEELQQAIEDGFTHKIWKTENDARVRKTHRAVEGKKIPIMDMFEVGNGLMRYPHDWYYNPKECYNCRCALVYSKKYEKDDSEVYFGQSDGSDNRERRISYGEERKFASDRGDIVARKAVRFSANNIYVDEKIKITQTQIRTISKRISDAKKIHGLGEECDVPVVVVDKPELLASYNPFSNTMYVSKNLALGNNALMQKQVGFAASGNPNSTMVHELFHWKDANEYKKQFGQIIDKTTYNTYQRERAIKKLSENGIDISDTDAIMKISEYSRRRVVQENDFEEAYTEYRTKMLLEKK